MSNKPLVKYRQNQNQNHVCKFGYRKTPDHLNIANTRQIQKTLTYEEIYISFEPHLPLFRKLRSTIAFPASQKYEVVSYIV